jgi:NADH-quinone oxidoreductase subunit G
MKKHDHVCSGCSTGCSITVEENQDRIYRLKPRENPHINQWWMCDEGRYGYHHVHNESRSRQPMRRDASGEYTPVDWSPLVRELDSKLRNAAESGLAAVVSPHLTVEEAYLLVTYVRSLNPNARLALGPVPEIGKDEKFKNGFTIRAEKCPNRRGVEEVLRHFDPDFWPYFRIAKEVAAGSLAAVWFSGGYKTPGLDAYDENEIKSITAAELLIVADLFPSQIWELAHYRLPAAAFAERAGSFVNHADRLQSFTWAVRPPQGVWTEGQLFWRFLDRPGLYDPKTVLAEIAATIPYFAPAADGVSPTGVQLTSVQTASQPVR